MIVKSGLQTLFALALASSLTVYVSTKTLGQAGGRANGVELPVPKNEPVPEPKTKVICTSVGGSHLIDTTPGVSTTVPMKCCPKGELVEDPSNPSLDKNGDLKCVKET
jgi:hypothetical protein